MGRAWRVGRFSQVLAKFLSKISKILLHSPLPCRLFRESPGDFFPRWAYVGLSWPYVGPSWLHVGLSWPYVGPSWPYVGLSWPILDQLGPNLPQGGPSKPQLGPTWPQLDSNLAQHVPTWRQLDPQDRSKTMVFLKANCSFLGFSRFPFKMHFDGYVGNLAQLGPNLASTCP